MHVLHIALPGCLKAPPIRYGCTPDTGGHITYLLDLVKSAQSLSGLSRCDVLTRRFQSDTSVAYLREIESLGPRSTLYRISGATLDYLSKEAIEDELETLTDNAVNWMLKQQRKPDLIHAHFSDAGYIANALKRAFDIPFIYTPHALGRPKLATGQSVSYRRIALEEQAILAAGTVLVSSRDEASLQLRDYSGYAPEKIRVVAPGVDTTVFRNSELSSDEDGEIPRCLQGFLRDPAKPVILLIARPVWKKNIHSLLEIYASSEKLRSHANLVIVAGQRYGCSDDEQAGAVSSEQREVWKNLLGQIDEQDLYGSVAYPKMHEQSDISELFAYARKTRGVFVNPALHEPFGLTLIEAAASGLPVVATNRGGPADILAACQHGRLVDPLDHGALAAALGDLLTDTSLWQDCSDNALANVGKFSWIAYHQAYMTICISLVAEKRISGLAAMHPQSGLDRRARPRPVRSAGNSEERLIVCDIDNTLTGDRDACQRFSHWHDLHCRQTNADSHGSNRKYLFGVATGRDLHAAQQILREWRLPAPSIWMTSVGSEIYHTTMSGLLQRDRHWNEALGQSWDLDEVRSMMAMFPEFTPQEAVEQRQFKCSYTLSRDQAKFRGTDSRFITKRITQRLEARGLLVRVIFSHNRFLDILPAAAGKAAAVRRATESLGLSWRNVVVAGDSGNDHDMLADSEFGIVVANRYEELDTLRSHPGSYFSEHQFADGVLDGIEAFERSRVMEAQGRQR